MSSVETRKPQGSTSMGKVIPLLRVTIHLGTASRAFKRYKALKHMLQDSILHFRKTGDAERRITLILFSKALRWRMVPEYNWLLELEADEWSALSCGLRNINTPGATSMYQWLNAHKIGEYDHE